jgi:hypothetical protein
MITKFKIFEDKDRGTEIIYTFKNKAITFGREKPYYYNVNILYFDKPSMIKNGYDYVLSIQGTPGSWYVKTLLEGNSKHSNIFSIQGDDWYCDNWQDIYKELIEILPILDTMRATKKYNL